MTEPLLRFDPVVPLWLLATVSLAVILVLVWLEIKKPTRFKLLRLVSAAVLVLSIVGLLLQPTIKKQRSDFSILVTENSSKAILDSLQEQLPGASLYYFGGSRNSTSNVVDNAYEIPSDKIKIVTGDGLSPSSMDMLEGIRFNFFPSATPDGIVKLVLPKNAKVLNEAVIYGVINSSADSSKIILEGPGGKEDSVTVKKGFQVFSLRFYPKEQGRFSYSISINGRKEIIPVEVKGERKRKILVIQMFPTFETGYLKNVLAKDHQIVFRYQLSRNTFRYEYLNHEVIRADRLSAEILNVFDLLMLDSDALSGLSVAERKSLERSIEKGLGVLILLNENPRSNRLLSSILPITFKAFAKDTAGIRKSDKHTVLPAWPVQAGNAEQIIPTIENSNRILAGYVYSGFGKIGFNLLQETYKLTLEGDSATYKNLWSTIVQGNARTVRNNFQIKVKNDFPILPLEPVTIEVIGSTETTPTIVHDGTEIAMIEDAAVDDVWTTKVWPDNAGWHEVMIKGDSSKHAYFVSKYVDWKSLRAANSIRNTKAMSTSEPVTSSTSLEYKPFAPIMFYLMFLIAASVLWLVPKI